MAPASSNSLTASSGLSLPATIASPLDSPLANSSLAGSNLAGANLAVPGAPQLDEHLALTAETSKAIDAAARELDLNNPSSMVLWGSKAQEGMARVSRELVGNAKNKDLGPVGNALTQAVLRMKGFKVSDITQGEQHVGWIGKLFRRTVLPIAIAKERYSAVDNQMQAIVRDLDRHIATLMHDMVGLERLYEESKKAYQLIMIYIEAGQMMLRHIDEVQLPHLEAAIRADNPMSSQDYARMQQVKQRLELRVHDLILTRTALFQSLPMIATIEDNDVNMVGSIQSTIANAYPMWQQRIAMLLTVRHTADAAAGQEAARDFGNQMLEETAKLVHQTSNKVNTQVQKGIFDAASIEKATAEIVGMLEDAQQIYRDAQIRRQNDLVVVEQAEAKIRTALENKAS